MRLEDIPLDDKPTFALLGRGETVGLFQLESPGYQRLMKKMKPRSLDDIANSMALWRPGAMAHADDFCKRMNGQGGSREGWRIHRDLKPLDDVVFPTMGILLFQEQVMQALNVVCGWDYAQADIVLGALRKKDREKLASAQPRFMADGLAKGVSRAGLTALWDTLIPFADYSFGRAHSYGYAYISYYSAYLKANAPVSYMTALLSSAKPEDRERYLAEARRMGITLLPPDINDSGANFTKAKEGIRYGLSHIKGLGEPSAKAVVAGRRYTSLDDFFRRADPKALNARTLDALIRCGVFDSLWECRESLLAEAGRLVGLASRHREAAATGQLPLCRPGYAPRGSVQQTGGEEGGAAQEEGGGRAAARRADELALLGAQLSYPTVTLRASRALTEPEWGWLRQLLQNGAPAQPVVLEMGALRMGLPKTTYSGKLAQQLQSVGIEAEER